MRNSDAGDCDSGAALKLAGAGVRRGARVGARLCEVDWVFVLLLRLIGMVSIPSPDTRFPRREETGYLTLHHFRLGAGSASSSSIHLLITSNPPCQKAFDLMSIPASDRMVAGLAEPP